MYEIFPLSCPVRVVARGAEARLSEKQPDQLGMPRKVLVEALDRLEALEAAGAAGAREQHAPPAAARALGDALEAIQLGGDHVGHGDSALDPAITAPFDS